ncbi:hypothetical protein A3196_07185 [Candidatus Thiodiazotropha endoloripes]|uniref:Uncharacterized protein n=1 Tax=Candidatus Thiodiazotropha endoloripes TaxID=1818881 RepID=A0A1E2UP60_9GAMM|nr:hypothetical protein A3196_07185 [Candidatus Thiodiazotropha endoloripes]
MRQLLLHGWILHLYSGDDLGECLTWMMVNQPERVSIMVARTFETPFSLQTETTCHTRAYWIGVHRP